MKKENIIKILGGCLLVTVAIIIALTFTFIKKQSGTKENGKEVVTTTSADVKEENSNTNNKENGLREIGTLQDIKVLKCDYTIKLGEALQEEEYDIKVTNVKEMDKICFNNYNRATKSPGKYIVVESVIHNKSNKPFRKDRNGGLLYDGDKYFDINWELSSDYNSEENSKQGSVVLMPGVLINGSPADMLNPGMDYKYYTVYDVPKDTKVEDLEVGEYFEEGFVNVWSCKK